ncbi:MaoC family dehydratase N-terminal domain-containing protein [Albimonas pacifica]|uniref:Acyl dehydratase n=1 Tax=Albimonas pacifica TaxID=1114924 RepID=A0A1I3E6E6_9RHOB|nr:MaoC family dehydratase N-terminal domain-containing protein [Albimonas pacifica]SFH94526.1 Acyl dehydratase [Albimonas pacifica]
MLDASAVGHASTPVEAAVEPGRLRAFLDAIGETSPVYRDPAAAAAAGFRGLPVPPTYLFCLEMMDAADPFELLGDLGIDLSTILHGEQSFAYHAPAVVGDRLRFASRVVSVTEKKGGALVLVGVETAVTTDAGLPIADCARTIVVRNGRPR